MGVLNGIFTFMSYFLFILFIFLSYCFQLFNNLIVFLIFSFIFIFATPYIYNKLKNQKIIINNKLYLLSYFLLMSYGILITLRYVFDSYVYNNIEYFVFKCLLFMFLMFVLNILGKVMNGYQLEKRPKTLANHILITIFLIFLVLINQLFLLKYFSLIQFLFSIMNIIVLVYILIAPRYYDFENENFATAYFIMVILSFLTKNYILLVISAILVYNIWKETKKA